MTEIFAGISAVACWIAMAAFIMRRSSHFSGGHWETDLSRREQFVVKVNSQQPTQFLAIETKVNLEEIHE